MIVPSKSLPLLIGPAIFEATSGPVGGVSAPIPVWPSLAPGASGNELPEEELNRDDGIRRLTNVSEPAITVYQPTAAQNTGAAVLVCPGGGYNILAIEHEGTRICEWLAGLGVTGVLLKYRVPAGAKGEANRPPLQDAQRALRLVRHRADEWGITANRIGILGFSAGGHLAAAAAACSGEPAYEAADSVDTIDCKPDFAVLIYPAYLLDDEDSNCLSQEVAVTEGHCPAFLLHAGDDHIDPAGSLVYWRALKDVGVPAEVHIYQDGGHGFGMGHRDNLIGMTWQDRCADWLKVSGLLAKEG
ncbi:MAG: alpha/beta hydrolase [Lentisphaerae bacterium]|jgi:acetyl esterase/lipase|nr:alpha/beta hydrolase [Lentisphaerota bacterium]MBT4818256.1 alpha/beta hydrolase [Lentisphaerota bacterium]MBT5606058.1 alpha/beta hydrolase [Lentisphaerota bacterium]MBT7058053.1 alpha/beta hydrolase [Lentisphaerota bacterium]MBT7845955.1 alpha/beta hydrolase [Lentisphaerota bacterium]